jgi:hypothetical protein
MVQLHHTTWARQPMKVEWALALTTSCRSLHLLLQVVAMTKVASLPTEAAMVAADSARTMEAEAQAPASLACHLASPAQSHQASPQRHPVTRQPRQAPPALASRLHHQATWRHLPRRTTRLLRRGTVHQHRRLIRQHLLPATRRRLLNTLRRPPTTVLPHRRSWEEQHRRPTARRRHSTAQHRRNTVRRARNTRQAATGALLLRRRHPNTAQRRRGTRPRAQLGPSPRPRRATARRLRARHTRQRKSSLVIVVNVPPKKRMLIPEQVTETVKGSLMWSPIFFSICVWKCLLQWTFSQCVVGVPFTRPTSAPALVSWVPRYFSF